jgi:hypothetical protein
MSGFLSHRRSVIIGTAAAATLLLVAGCNDVARDFDANAAPRARAPGVPVALISLNGAPEAVISRLSISLAKQATRREIIIVGVDGKPRYQVRGYVTLQATAEERSSLVWTFDLYDSQRKRARRITGSELLASKGEDWSAINDVAIERVSSNALDDIAEFLAPFSGPIAAPVAAQSPSSKDQARAAALTVSRF